MRRPRPGAQRRQGPAPRLALGLVLVLGVALAGCGGGAKDVGPDRGVDQTLALDAGQTARLDDQALITFVNVVNESRCPKNAMCPWAGTATVRLKLRPRDDQPADDPWLELLAVLNGGVSRDDTAGLIPVETAGYVVTLLELRPEPVAGVSVLESSYRAVVRVKKPPG
ncbi:MAG: hypothetical protein ACREOU_01195 [Candidatus Eiseniibacteriota bacterium]